MQVGAVAIERRAIRADDLVIAAHVKEDMRMILGRPGADAHQLLGRYADGAHANVVVEMGYRIMGHNEPSNSVFERSQRAALGFETEKSCGSVSSQMRVKSLPRW